MQLYHRLLLSSLLPCLLLSSGCVNFNATQTYYDAEARQTVTNNVKATFVFSQTAATRLEVAKRTKTTSALISARDVTNSADSESLGTILGAAIKAASK